MLLSSGARRLYRLLESHGRKNGWISLYHETMARRLACSETTIRKWLTELRKAGALCSRKRQHSSAEYTLFPLVENGRSVGRSVGRSGAAHIGMSTDPELRASSVARKPPSSEVTNYRTEFGEEWHRLHQGWVEPAGRRVERQIRLVPNPDIVPALADSARSAGLSPYQAILSLDRAVCNAEERVSRAMNPPGLIIHIARALWKTA